MKRFYENEDVGEQGRRRLLVISYHFPPDPAVGARRWGQFAHFVAEHGWGMDVFMRGDLAAQDTGPTRHKLPTGIRVFAVQAPVLRVESLEAAVWRVVKRPDRERAVVAASAGQCTSATDDLLKTASAKPSRRPTSIPRSELRWALQSPRGWMRAYWAALDFARVSAWGDNVMDAVASVFDANVHQAVIASGPPFMTHDVGRRLSRRYGIPFVMDMRDPWSHVERLPEGIATPAWTRLAKRFERKAVERATLIIANTEVARRQLVATYPLRSRDIITVTNGSDDDVPPESNRQDRFVIAHAGTVYLDRDPRALFEAAATVIRKLDLTPEQLSLEFIGELEAVGGFPIRDVARAEGIEAYVHTGPPRPHAEAMHFMSQAAMLVTMSGTNMAAIPAKTYECVRFRAWVLALSEPGSATALLLEGTGADVATPGDAAAIAEIIERRYLEHRAGVCPEPVGRDVRFSRRHQAGILMNAIESRLARPRH